MRYHNIINITLDSIKQLKLHFSTKNDFSPGVGIPGSWGLLSYMLFLCSNTPDVSEWIIIKVQQKLKTYNNHWLRCVERGKSIKHARLPTLCLSEVLALKVASDMHSFGECWAISQNLILISLDFFSFTFCLHDSFLTNYIFLYCRNDAELWCFFVPCCWFLSLRHHSLWDSALLCEALTTFRMHRRL